ncbi:unnamed protein product [Medioppia subpectinata]|uniref:SWI/SNF-related matrix-associated actin-dependent regulator of chromatin subfamily A containing DEAD/H box 1 homolog n=1 Tax=Medioppia subpectinata TaxID=1979941 RepID=A0A7R9Q131_9ACAR|nr:unnamed protein product [Medioppia subpectinata]CAG2107895.1 unnamed protein product [Medioppia subpectinata]
MADSDDDIMIIGGRQTPKPLVKNGVKEPTDDAKSEVSESPELIRKRDVNDTQSTESPINLPKSRVKRVIDDSDDEDVSRKQQKTSSNSYSLNEDAIGKMAFEEMCESTIRELQQLFPEIDICEIQDALIQSDWSVFNASIKLGNLYDCPEPESKTAVKAEAVKTEPKICTNDEKMKSLDNYRKWRPNSKEEESSSYAFNSIKNNKNKFSKRNFDLNKDSESSEDSDGGENYNKFSEGVVCVDSSDEDNSDDDESKNVIKDKSSSKSMAFRTQDLKDKVIDFLQTANYFELQMVPSVSGKKIDLITNLRPFTDWSDAVIKFTNANLSTEILDKCFDVVRAQEVVRRLMNSCQEMTKDLSKTVDKLTALEQPKIINSEMKLSHYQLIGLNWLALMYKKGINCILADEMGLGKTIQVIAFFAYLRERKSVKGPHLVIVPSSTLENWSREFQTWCPDIKLLLYYGSQDERALIREQISRHDIEFDVILTTYNIAQTPGDKSLFKKSKFKYCVFDEAHYLKNIKSTRYMALMNLKAKHRLLLTGTPLQNNLVELMSLLIFTMPHMFSGKTDQIKTLFTYTNVCKDNAHRISYIKERIEQAKKIMKPFVLRRLKSEVLQELPAKIDHILTVPMNADQELKYADLIENYTREIKYKKITFEDSDSEEKFKSGNGMLMNLRKVANHPLLIRQHYDDKKLREMSQLMLKEETHREANPQLIFEDMQVMHDFELYKLCKHYKSLSNYTLDESYIEDSGKFQELDSLLVKYRNEGKRVLLFSQFTMVLDIIEEFMKLRFYQYLRLDGSTKVADRLDLIDQYNNNPDLFIFLLSTRAGGLGINLTAASVVIIHDIDFNPYNDKQAEDRCHRIGQTKEVIVYRLISQNSIEEGMLKIAEEKLKLGRDISESKQDTKNDNEEQMEKSDVKTLLRAALKL